MPIGSQMYIVDCIEESVKKNLNGKESSKEGVCWKEKVREKLIS